MRAGETETTDSGNERTLFVAPSRRRFPELTALHKNASETPQNRAKILSEFMAIDGNEDPNLSTFIFCDDSLVERLEFYDRSAVVIAHPESDWRCGIVHEHSSNIRRPWEEIIGHLT